MAVLEQKVSSFDYFTMAAVYYPESLQSKSLILFKVLTGNKNNAVLMKIKQMFTWRDRRLGLNTI